MIFPQTREAGINRDLAGVIRDQAGIVRPGGLTISDLITDSLYSFYPADNASLLDGDDEVCGDGDYLAKAVNGGTGAGEFAMAIGTYQPQAFPSSNYVRFDGHDDRIYAPLANFSGGYTICIKLTRDEITVGARLVSLFGSPYNLFIQTVASNGVGVYQGSLRFSGAAQAGNEVRVVVSHDPGTGRITGIINGESFDVAEGADISGGGSLNFYVGGLSGTTYNFKGDYELVTVADRPYSASEVEQAYAAITAGD